MTDQRNAMIGKIHVAKKQLALDDDTYRDLLERATGKRSAKDMSASQLEEALKALQKAGFKPVVDAARARPRYASSSMMSKIRALWMALHKGGVVLDPSEAALASYVKRVVGQEMGKLDAAQATKAVEGLKAWAKRKGVEVKS